MKKGLLLLLLASVAFSSAGMVAGVTFAANYTPPVESYEFNASSSDNSVSVFSIGHYFHGGQGTVDDPYLITTPVEMRNFAKLQNYGYLQSSYYYKLKNSFTWSGDAMEPIGSTNYPFLGHFVGNNKTISAPKITASENRAGLFGVTSGAAIGNFVLAGPKLTCNAASTSAGFLVGEAKSSTTINNVYVYGGSSSFQYRAVVMTGASGGATLHAPFIVGTSTNVTVTQSGFVTAVDAIDPSSVDASLIHTSPTGTPVSSGTVTVSSSSTVTFYDNGTSILVESV